MRLNLINEWLKQGVEIDLVVGQRKGELNRLVPKQINVFTIAESSKLQFPYGLYKYIIKRSPTHILSAGTDVNAITLLVHRLLRKRIPTVISFHIELSKDLEFCTRTNYLKNKVAISLLRIFAPDCRAIICVSKGVEENIRKHLKLKNSKIHVIYNPTITPETEYKLLQPIKDGTIRKKKIPYILFIGRFVDSKGIDILVEAYARIRHKISEHLVLIGSGPIKADIQNRVNRLSLTDRTHIYDFQENTFPWYREAKLFVLPSRNEGLPNVLIEALASGTQVVSTNCPSGPSEILCDGRYGQLVPVDDPESLAEAILRSLNGEFHVPVSTLKERAEAFSSLHAANSYMRLIRMDSHGAYDSP